MHCVHYICQLKRKNYCPSRSLYYTVFIIFASSTEELLSVTITLPCSSYLLAQKEELQSVTRNHARICHNHGLLQQNSQEEYRPWKWSRCYRKVLRISYKDHVTNEKVRAKIQQATGPHEDFLTIVKRSKLQWYGHVSRSSRLAKNILQDTVKGGRRQGRQRKRWEDNIGEWTGL